MNVRGGKHLYEYVREYSRGTTNVLGGEAGVIRLPNAKAQREAVRDRGGRTDRRSGLTIIPKDPEEELLYNPAIGKVEKQYTKAGVREVEITAADFDKSLPELRKIAKEIGADQPGSYYTWKVHGKFGTEKFESLEKLVKHLKTVSKPRRDRELMQHISIVSTKKPEKITNPKPKKENKPSVKPKSKRKPATRRKPATKRSPKPGKPEPGGRTGKRR